MLLPANVLTFVAPASFLRLTNLPSKSEPSFHCPTKGYHAGKIIDHNALGRDAIVGLHVVEGPFLEQYLMWILIGVY